MSKREGTLGTALVSLLIGAGVGAVLTALWTPRTGKQMRRELRRRYEDTLEGLSEQAEHLRKQADHLRKRADELMERGSELAQDARDKVEPIARSIRR